MNNLFNYHRRASTEVAVGNCPLGGEQPIRVQSMATVPTTDTEGCVEQARRIIQAGGEYVRFTTQGTREAENMANIRLRLRQEGFDTPLVADVHFNPHVAEVAARNCEKVRINPGNYVDPARTFKQLEYTDEEYVHEIKKIEETLLPLLAICREHGTALRIGVNHGSLSDRIMSRYGDTPQGIVESCMEFLRICKREQFHNVVISIKASNTMVMVQSVRLLVEQMDKEDMHFPLHLGVTEAGEGEDGRIKSAVGIGALLADGIGDTIRVSLSEEPECEIPVARHLAEHFVKREGHAPIDATPFDGFDYAAPRRRKTKAIGIVGGDNLPVVVCPGACDESKRTGNIRPDFIYTGKDCPPHTGGPGQYFVMDHDAWLSLPGTYPLYQPHEAGFIKDNDIPLKFLLVHYGEHREEYLSCLRNHPEVAVVSVSSNTNPLGEHRALAHELMREGLENPLIFLHNYKYGKDQLGMLQLDAAADMGALMADGLADGIWLSNEGDISYDDLAHTAFAILQAGRLRMSKTEYISCPGCGRTLYDLQATIARIKAATQHLKGLKIGIMGCIVNGPGEMADADYGYVGAGPGRVSLYRRKECVEKNIPESLAVEKLLLLIEQTEKEKP